MSSPPLQVAAHLSHEDLVHRFHTCRAGSEKLRWQAVLLKSEGRSSNDIADICKRRPDWVRRTVRRYNADGPEALREHRGGAFSTVLDEAGRMALREAILHESPPGGGLWTGRKVADWIEAHTGLAVSDQTGLNYLHALGFTPQRPRPRHPQADREAQEAFKKGGSQPRSKR